MQQANKGERTFEAGEAIPQFSRVTLQSDGTVDVAAITEIGSGIAQTPAFAAGEYVTVKLWNSEGTFQMIAGEAFAVGADLYTEANGKVQDTAASTSFKFARALAAATADGDIVECELLHAAGVTAEA
jgi:hypothetical protein